MCECCRIRETDVNLTVSQNATAVLEAHCLDCHDAETQKGEVRLDALGGMALEARLDLLNRVQEQLFLKAMPPKKKAQPSEADREALAGWVSGELRKHGASKLEEKLRYPSYGNYVDHDKLFSGEVKAKAWSPVRRWLVSPQIFHERVMDVFGLEGRERKGFVTRKFLVSPIPSCCRIIRAFAITTLTHSMAGICW